MVAWLRLSVHRDLKPEHLMIHNGALKVGDFGSSGCATLGAAFLASTLQKQALDSAAKQQQHLMLQQQDPEQLNQQQLLDKLGQLQQDQQLHLQADCKVEAAVAAAPLGSCGELPTHKDQPAVQRFGVPVDAVSGPVSPSLRSRCSVQAVRDAMNFRIGSIEYMAPEMLNKPTAAEVFHLVGVAVDAQAQWGGYPASCCWGFVGISYAP
jgi:serine/threonine protein kinase